MKLIVVEIAAFSRADQHAAVQPCFARILLEVAQAKQHVAAVDLNQTVVEQAGHPLKFNRAAVVKAQRALVGKGSGGVLPDDQSAIERRER